MPPPAAPNTSPSVTVEGGRVAQAPPGFRTLWAAYSVSEIGSAVSAGALPLIAIVVLDVSSLQVSLLAVLAGVASAIAAVPMGPWIEFRRKRPVMIGADLIRFAAIGSVPVAAGVGALTYEQLCLVAVVQTAGGIAFTAASGAHLKNLVPVSYRATAHSRFETTQWTANAVGSPLGGALVSWLGATTSLTIDATSFLLSAMGIRAIRAREPVPSQRTGGRYRISEITEGWRYIFAHRGLMVLFCNALLFGGGIMAVVPIVAVLMLSDLGFTPWQYSLTLGIPCFGGVIGSLLAGPLIRRSGLRAVLLGAGVGRALWMGLLPFAAPGTAGLILIIGSETLLLFFASMFNPAFATYRMSVTADGSMARVITSWSVSSRTAQPVFIAAAGILATATSPRTAIAVTAVFVFASAAILPWRADR